MKAAVAVAGPRFNLDAFVIKEPGSLATTSRLDAVALNPQPLPPKESELTARLLPSSLGRFDAVALNPQPLPPREIASAFQSVGNALSDDRCGTAPRLPLPLPGPWSELIAQALASR